MRTRFWIIIIIALLFVVVGVASYKLLGTGVTVLVKNASGSEIANLQVKFTGGSKTLPKLKPAESFATKVNPYGESHLVIEFVDSLGEQHSATVGVYFERNYRGTIYITLEPDGKVTWKDETKI